MATRLGRLKVAACQLGSGEDLDRNLEEVESVLDQAAADGVDLAVLPESLDFLGDISEAFDHAAPLDGRVGQLIAAKAKQHGMWVVGGTTHEHIGERRIGNTSQFFSPEGEMLGSYRKMHMFDVELDDGFSYRESATTQAGDALSTIDVEGIPVSTAVCYDLRFPELFRLYAMNGTEVMVLPAAFTAFTGAAHWDTLIRARAIENQFFVVAAGQFGPYKPNGRSYGHSMIVDPWGTVLAMAPDRPGTLAIATIDLAAIEQARSQVPSIANRRDDLYRLEWINDAS